MEAAVSNILQRRVAQQMHNPIPIVRLCFNKASDLAQQGKGNSNSVALCLIFVQLFVLESVFV